MAFESETRKSQTRTGPKLFTEYSTEALLALICQIGIAIVAIGLLSFIGVLIPLLSYILPISAPILGILIVGVGILGLYQGYLGWKMHKGEIPAQKCVQVDMITVALSVITMATMVAIYPLLFLLGAQVLLAIIVIDIVAIVFLRNDNVVQEFEWWRTSDQSAEYSSPNY